VEYFLEHLAKSCQAAAADKGRRGSLGEEPLQERPNHPDDLVDNIVGRSDAAPRVRPPSSDRSGCEGFNCRHWTTCRPADDDRRLSILKSTASRLGCRSGGLGNGKRPARPSPIICAWGIGGGRPGEGRRIDDAQNIRKSDL